MQALAEAKAQGAKVSGEASPHHLTLTDEAVRSTDSRFKMNPPLRAESDRQALIEALRSGVIECVATDHAPHARHEKEVPFEQAPMGTIGLETAFAAIYTELVVPGELELPTLIERMTAGGALYGLHTPRIAPGEPANVCLIDTEAAWTVGENGYASKSANCSFDGMRLRGRVLLTVAGGVIAHRQPMLVASDDGDSTRRRAQQPGGTLMAQPTPPRTCCSTTAPRFDGIGCGADEPAVGEIVFTTSMAGYQEAMTDPSYAGQLITFTYPQIGNYGVMSEAMESDRVHARAAIMRAGNRSRRRARRRGGLAELADRLRDPRDHRPRHARARPPYPRRRARCAAASSRPRSPSARPAR